MSKKYYTYILTHERDHIFYVGVTNNIQRRMSEHKMATFGSHVGHYNIRKLVYFEEHLDIRIAIKREKIIKKWKREWKINIITEVNPEWNDLSDSWDLSLYKKEYIKANAQLMRIDKLRKMTDAYVKQTIENEVGYIEFFHPAHNSLPGDLLATLVKTISDAGDNDKIKVIVLKSGGDRTFCAGASFKELININDAAIGKVFFSGFANVINAMRKCPKFIIGRIQGKTVGGGVGLAASTDYCMGTKFAAIKLSELNIGIGPFVVGPAIERKMGLSAMSQIAIDANSFYPAEWAKQKGLFTHVYETTEELDDAVKTTAEHLCTYNAEAIMEMKKVFWKGTDDWDELLAERAETSGRLVLSDFTKEKLKTYK